MAVTLLGVAEAMFPLVGLVCARLMSMHDGDGFQFRSYEVIASAAAVPSASCVVWLIEHRHKFKVLDVGAATSEIPRSSTSSSSPAATDVQRISTAVIKEMTAVLIGLCAGGHVELAHRMIGDGTEIGDCTCASAAGTLPVLWSGRFVKGWSFCGGSGVPETRGGNNVENARLLREKVREYVKSSDCALHFLMIACGSVNVDEVKWLLSALKIWRDDVPWALYTSLLYVFYCGNIESFKWLPGEFDLVNDFPEFALPELVDRCAIGKCPSNIKWCEEVHMPIGRFGLLLQLVGNKHSTLEDCKWLEDEIMEGGVIEIIQQAKKVEFVKWALSNSVEDPTEEAFNDSCKNLGNVSLAEWLHVPHQKGMVPHSQSGFQPR
ncbi:hypothetical protein Pelo_18152 [Pelomyxa schiedti]|nr:hypothetical protein Pelo_18152 [Pelomyxa schiedti]